MYEERFYRELVDGGLSAWTVIEEESDLAIYTDFFDDGVMEYTQDRIKKIRTSIQTAFQMNKEFEGTLEPLGITMGMPNVAKQMIRATQKAQVGPMAAVAGGVSQKLAEYLYLEYGFKNIIVENGGDLYIRTSEERHVLIYAGESPLSNKLKLIIKPEDSPIGICTSSGTVGHSLSFGKADAVVVLSKDTFLADAMATSIGNKVKSAQDIESAIEFGKSVEGILGLVVIIGDKIGMWGEMEVRPV